MKDLPLTTKAYNSLKKKLIDLHLRPGEILMVQSLAKDLGLSRTPVREALIHLKQEGFVQETDGRKFKVTEISLETINEIYEIREQLECLAIKRVALQRSMAQIKELEKTMLSMKKAVARLEYSSFIEYDLRFHEQIVKYSGNRTLEGLLKTLADKVQRIRYLTLNIEKRMENSVLEHSKILKFIKERNPKGARHALHEHLTNVRQGLNGLLRSPDSSFMGKVLLSSVSIKFRKT
jgi:DNA-binding GntR family transcriptional regulator